MPHYRFAKAGPSGAPFDVLVVRGTFDLSDDGRPMPMSGFQSPIVEGDEFEGPIEIAPLRAVLRREGNIVLFKPRTDVHVTGAASAPAGKPAQQWVASVQVGPVQKSLRLHGPRRFRRDASGWALEPAEPTTTVELDYRLAFGGLYDDPGAPAGPIYKADNPAGCGWMPDEEALSSLPAAARRRFEPLLEATSRLTAPQIEHPERPVQHPMQRLPTEGFGPMARWCEPRIRHVGPCDERWRETRFPLLPEGFDPLFYQSAHPGLISRDHLHGDEPVVLTGLLPEGVRRMRLPGVAVVARVIHASGRRCAGPLRLDTVGVDLDERNVVLVWRAAFDREDPVVDLAVGAMTSPETARYA